MGTVLQVAALIINDSPDILLIANTHLYYHPECDHIRLLQLQITFLYIEKEIIAKLKDKVSDVRFVILLYTNVVFLVWGNKNFYNILRRL